MSIKKGNSFLKVGDFSPALIEYAAVDSASLLAKHAAFNTRLIVDKILNSFRVIEPLADSKENTTLSVIIPCFNVEHLVEASIASVLMQLWAGCEIIRAVQSTGHSAGLGLSGTIKAWC